MESQKHILLNNEQVEYTLRLSSRAKRLRITVLPGGYVTVTAPRMLGEKAIERFVTQSTQWITRTLERLKKLPALSFPKSSKKEYALHKEAALELVKSRLEHFNKTYNFSYKNIRIKNQKSLWGSCSRSGNLNFNYKIALLPAELSDYIIVHELCHRGQFDHSKAFWELVAKTIPNHRELRKKLKGQLQ